MEITFKDIVESIDGETITKESAAILIDEKLKKIVREVGDKKYQEGKTEGINISKEKYRHLEIFWSLIIGVVAIGLAGGLLFGIFSCADNSIRIGDQLSKKEMAECSAGDLNGCMLGWQRVYNHLDPSDAISYESAYFNATGKYLIPDATQRAKQIGAN